MWWFVYVFWRIEKKIKWGVNVVFCLRGLVFCMYYIILIKSIYVFVLNRFVDKLISI